MNPDPTSNEEAKSSHEPRLIEKVGSWLETEGFPLEYTTANAFRKYGFHALQGQYVPDATKDTLREVDVVASMTAQTDEGILRVFHFVECKFSRHAPWVVFTSPTTSMAPSACVSQTIGTQMGEAILWTIAGNHSLHDLGLFATPLEGGFGGRQAFEKKDSFYEAVQGASREDMLVHGNGRQAELRSTGRRPRVRIRRVPSGRRRWGAI